MQINMKSLQKLFKLMREHSINTLDIPEVVKIQLNPVLSTFEYPVEEQEEEKEEGVVVDRYDAWSTGL